MYLIIHILNKIYLFDLTAIECICHRIDTRTYKSHTISHISDLADSRSKAEPHSIPAPPAPAPPAPPLPHH